MINKLKEALNNQEKIKATVLMYGRNDFFDEEIYILGDNPLICVHNDELKDLNPIDYIGREVEYIPIKIDEEKEVVIGKIVNFKNKSKYPLEKEENLQVGDKLEGYIKDLFPTGCFIPVLPGKDALCYFSPIMNKDIDIEEGSRVIFTINKICDGRYRGKVLKVLS